ncbi:MAG: hypothetical protein RIG84_13005 [Roseovarius sp.]
MRRAGAVAAAALLLAGCAGTPDGVTEESIARYEAAVVSIGCEMKYESDYLPVELQAGLTREQVSAINGYMLARDKAVRLEDGGMRLTTGGCA